MRRGAWVGLIVDGVLIWLLLAQGCAAAGRPPHSRTATQCAIGVQAYLASAVSYREPGAFQDAYRAHMFRVCGGSR